MAEWDKFLAVQYLLPKFIHHTAGFLYGTYSRRFPNVEYFGRGGGGGFNFRDMMIVPNAQCTACCSKSF